jgi:hypothetical protein
VRDRLVSLNAARHEHSGRIVGLRQENQPAGADDAHHLGDDRRRIAHMHQHGLAGHQIKAVLSEWQPFPHPTTQAAFTRTLPRAPDPLGFTLDTDDLGVGGQQGASSNVQWP